MCADTPLHRQRGSGKDQPGRGHGRAPGPAGLLDPGDERRSRPTAWPTPSISSTALFHGQTSDPYQVRERLDIQEVNIQKEIKRHWKEISSYVVSVLRTTGIGDVEAEELAILPGMEELSAMMHVNQYRRDGRYDVIVLDCAPTAESMRFVSMPTTLDWYMKHIFPYQRSLLKAVRPLANKVSPVELPPTGTSPTSRTCSASWRASRRCSRTRRSPASGWPPTRRRWSCAKRSGPSSTFPCTA